LATSHRAIIRERPELLQNVLEALREMPFPVLLPLHPSTRSAISLHNLERFIERGASLRVVQPLPYSEMIILLSNCRMVLTDSGGLIKEAYYFKKPCITLDYQTEWIETLEGGWNVVVGPDKGRILAAAASIHPDPSLHKQDVFGIGQTARAILETLSAGGRDGIC
jgi:UDP-GlcNAc3NAcA epimerase